MKKKFTPIRIIAMIAIVTFTVYFREYMNIIIPIWIAIIATYVGLTVYARNVFDQQRAEFDREREEYILRLEQAVEQLGGSKDIIIEPRKETELQLVKSETEVLPPPVKVPKVNTGHGNKKVWSAGSFEEAKRNIDALTRKD